MDVCNPSSDGEGRSGTRPGRWLLGTGNAKDAREMEKGSRLKVKFAIARQTCPGWVGATRQERISAAATNCPGQGREQGVLH